MRLNVVYDEREKRSIVQLYTTTFLFTLAGIVFVILALIGLVIIPSGSEFHWVDDRNGDLYIGPAVASCFL